MTIINFISSDEFSAFSTIFSLLGDTAILILTIYTLHITAFSRKLEFISPSFSSSTFHGHSMTITVMNKTLHAIPVSEVVIYKRYKGKFYRVDFESYKPPISIDSWSMVNLQMDPFTGIVDWPIKNKEYGFDDYDELFRGDVVIKIESGKNPIWIKPWRKSPLRKAKKADKTRDYEILSVTRRVVDGEGISEGVDCQIAVVLKDINGQNVLIKSLGISTFNGGNDLLLEHNILGHNAFPGAGHTEQSISKALHDKLGIDQNNIEVMMLRKY